MNKSACFTGHRNISGDINEITEKLFDVLENMITEQNVTMFYCGGAYGWDAVSAVTVLRLRQKYSAIKLCLVLPCSNAEQMDGWFEGHITEFQHILANSDSVEYVSEHKTRTCMKERNARLVELADYCICYWNPNNLRSGTAQTVRMAQKKGIEIINLFESASNIVKSPVNGLTDGSKRGIIEVSYKTEVTTMPRKKKTETAPAVTEVKAEVVAEPVKEAVAEAPAPVEEKPAKKPVAKRAATAKKATKAKTPAKTATKSVTAPKETVKVQFGGDEFDFAEIKKAVEADYKSKVKGRIKTVEIYIKPEDKAVYYVINSDFSDKIEL